MTAPTAGPSKLDSNFEVTYLTPEHFPQLKEFWEASFPLNPMNDELLRERIFGPPDATPENSLAYFEECGRLIALSLLVPPESKVPLKPEIPVAGDHDSSCEERVGGFRWFGVHPDYRGKNIASQLIAESISRLQEMGTTVADFLSTPPYYIQPGVDTRLTGLISFLMRHGFEHYRTNFNMTVDLEDRELPDPKKIFDSDEFGYRVRRATEDDREAFDAYARKIWTAGWAIEGELGLKHDPVSLFIAERTRDDETEIVGFSVYETNQGLGCFGPTGVSIDHQGRGLGKKLLWATLLDMKELGRKQAVIGWIGPVDFYYQNAAAELGPVFWGMRKMLREVK